MRKEEKLKGKPREEKPQQRPPKRYPIEKEIEPRFPAKRKTKG